MMNLLIKFGVFSEQLARFYIAEIVIAIESVHAVSWEGGQGIGRAREGGQGKEGKG